MATSSVKKKVFFLVFCMASVTQGMYTTYFVSILTTIERIYQIPSKTAGAILSSTELGQILGSLLIAYYGGRGNKPKWIAFCMTLTAIAALTSTLPHFFLGSQMNSISSIPTKDLKSTESSQNFSAFQTRVVVPSQEQLCHFNPIESALMNLTDQLTAPNSGAQIGLTSTFRNQSQNLSSLMLALFFMCLLAIGFGSTAIITLGIPFLDDIVTREESPMYLGLSIGLRIFGPALGFLLGSFCIRLDANLFASSENSDTIHLINETQYISHNHNGEIGAWWLGLIIISLPLLILAIPMYFLSRLISDKDSHMSDFEDITYQAAEDHDIGGSHDFQTHVLAPIGDLDVTSNRTCFSSELDSSSREVLQDRHHTASSTSYFNHTHFGENYGKNITLDQPILTTDSILNKIKPSDGGQYSSSGANDALRSSTCMVVNHFGGLQSTSFTNDEAISLQHNSSGSSSSSAVVTAAAAATNSSSSCSTRQSTIGLSRALSRLVKNKLLLLRMLSGALHILPIAGFYTFFPKYLIEQFRITSSSANAISGLAGILFVGFGAFLGGTIVRVLNINSRLMTKWIATSALLYALGMILLMNLGCSQNQTVYYESLDFASTDCSTLCKCSEQVYNPVCANGTTYISPCLAGCKSYSVVEDKIIFDECGCSDISLPQLPAPANHINLNIATQGHCSPDCDNLKWYIIIFSLFTLIHSSCEVGSMMFNLRCVQPNDRTLALGLITFTTSLLGNIPCSVIYGSLIDLTCAHWDTLSQDRLPSPIVTANGLKGACRAYHNDSFRIYLHGTTALVMLLAFVVDFLISRRADEVDFYNENDSKGENIKFGLQKSTETI